MLVCVIHTRAHLLFYRDKKNYSEDYKINKPLSGLLVYRRIRPFAARLSSKFHICPRNFASKENVYFSENLSVAGIILRYIAAGRGLFTECLHLFSFRFLLFSFVVYEGVFHSIFFDLRCSAKAFV